MAALRGADVLLVFVKEPRPGAVKSRLAAVIGAEEAAAVYRALAEEEIRRTAPRGDEYERLFFFSPTDARVTVERWLPGQRLLAQRGGDLGSRMSAAFAQAFEEGARRAAVVGTDVPWLGREDVLEALGSLDVHDLAVGPASDGGYVLLAMKRHHPALFRDVAWGTEAVLRATLERAAALGLDVRVLRTMSDVDTAEDLAADWGRLRPILPAELAAALGRRLGLSAGPAAGG